MGLTKVESRKKQIEAEKLYLLGMAKDSIAREVGVNDLTIDRWCKGLNWDEHKKIVDIKIKEKLGNDVVEMVSRHIKLIRATQARYAQRISEGNMEVRPFEVLKSMEYEKELIDPREIKITQNNTQIKIEANIHQLVQMALNKPWKSKQILNS